MTTPQQPIRSAPVTVIGVVWFLAATLVSVSGRLQSLRPPTPQIVVLTLTVVLLVFALRSAALHQWISSLPVKTIVAFHLMRVVAGTSFLFYFSRGELAATFAIPSGWGDITVAVLAGVLLLTGSPSTPSRSRLYAVWNLMGFADIAFVVVTAARVGVADPDGMRRLLQLPLSWLPTFFVPIIMVSHVVLALRLSGRWRTPIELTVAAQA